MKKTVYLPEIFDLVKEVKTKKAKIEILQKFKDTKGLYNILQLTYDPGIKWVLTREEVEGIQYDQMDIADYDLAPSNLFLESRKRLYNYTSMKNPMLPKNKVSRLIKNMFSVFHEKDVELFMEMLDKKIEGLEEKVVYETFPGLLSGEPKKVNRKPGPKVKPKKTGKPGRPVGSGTQTNRAVKK